VDNRIKKIAKKRDLTEQFVETIIAGADNGFLKGWRDFNESYQMSALKSLVIKTELPEIYRLQGMISGLKKIENRIDEVLEDYKNE